jgi:hypothetical protein
MTTLQTQQAINTAALAVLETHGTEGLAQLESQVDALPTAEDLAAKADNDDVITLQTQQAINSAAVTALETHGTEGLAQAMAATTDAIVALQSHGTEGAPTPLDAGFFSLCLPELAKVMARGAYSTNLYVCFRPRTGRVQHYHCHRGA